MRAVRNAAVVTFVGHARGVQRWWRRNERPRRPSTPSRPRHAPRRRRRAPRRRPPASTTATTVPFNGLRPGDSGPRVTDLQTQARRAPLRRHPERQLQRGDDAGRHGLPEGQRPRSRRRRRGRRHWRSSRDPVIPGPLVPGGGSTRVEVDVARQVLFFYQGNALFKIVAVSTGSGQRFCVDGRCATAVTPGGSFRVGGKVERLADRRARSPVQAVVLQRQHRDPRRAVGAGRSRVARLRAGADELGRLDLRVAPARHGGLRPERPARAGAVLGHAAADRRRPRPRRRPRRLRRTTTSTTTTHDVHDLDADHDHHDREHGREGPGPAPSSIGPS